MRAADTMVARKTIESLATLGNGTIVDLAHILLRTCRGHRAALEALLDVPSEEATLKRLVRELRPWFIDELDDVQLDPDFVGALCARYGTLSGRHPELLVARAFAEALDAELGNRFQECFEAQGEVVLSPGAPFPVMRFDPRLWPDADMPRVNADPDNMSRRLDDLRHLRLFPDDPPPVEVRLRWYSPHKLANVRRRYNLGAAIPNRGVDEFEWTVAEREGCPRFFGVRPRATTDQEARVLALLQAADVGGLDVLVFPELSIGETMLAQVRHWFGTARRSLRVVVAGSRHLEIGGQDGAEPVRRNRASSLIAPDEEAAHDKFVPFVHKDGGIEHREDIHVMPKRLTLHLCQDFAFTVLICKDFLDEEAHQLLVRLQPRLVLVPAFSAKTQGFEANAARLTAAAQSMVVVANVPMGRDPAVALFARPTERNYLDVRRRPPGPPAVHAVYRGYRSHVVQP